MTITELHNLFLSSYGVGTDTRKDLRGKLFFALKGDNFNGNHYAHLALEQGASYAIIDEDLENKNDSFIRVDNVLQCLQQLARFHRDFIGIPIFSNNRIKRQNDK